LLKTATILLLVWSLFFCASFSGEWLGIHLANIAYRLKKKSLRVCNPAGSESRQFSFFSWYSW